MKRTKMTLMKEAAATTMATPKALYVALLSVVILVSLTPEGATGEGYSFSKEQKDKTTAALNGWVFH